jgi:hypothetical protein
MALAEAEHVCILKALKMGKMTNGLLVKLYRGVSEKFLEADKVLKSMTGDYDQLDPSLRKYVEWMGKHYCPAMYLKLLAVEAFNSRYILLLMEPTLKSHIDMKVVVEERLKDTSSYLVQS